MNNEGWRKILNEIDNIIPQGEDEIFDDWIVRIENEFLKLEDEIEELEDVIKQYEE